MLDEDVPPESKPDVSLFMSLHLGDLMKETGHLSPAEFGAHMRLVMAAWSRDGYLPGDVTRLRRLAGVDSAEWDSVWDVVGELWLEDETGRRYSATVLERVRKARDAKLRAVARGRAGGTAPHPTQRREQVESKSTPSREQVDFSSTSSRDEVRDGAEIKPSLRTPDSDLRDPDSGSGHRTPGKDCSQLPLVEATDEPALLTFPCAARPGQQTTWALTQSVVDEMSQAFPAVDVLGQARKAHEWLKAHPKQLKTANHMRAWIGNVWCSREQNRGGSRPVTPNTSGPRVAERW